MSLLVAIDRKSTCNSFKYEREFIGVHIWKMAHIPGKSKLKWLQVLLDLGSGDLTAIIDSLCLYLFFTSFCLCLSFSVSENMSRIPTFQWVDIKTTTGSFFFLKKSPSVHLANLMEGSWIVPLGPYPHTRTVTDPQCSGHCDGLNLGHVFSSVGS